MSKPRIAVVFGSDNDWPVMEKCVAQLREFGETPYVEAMSAHRSPDLPISIRKPLILCLYLPARHYGVTSRAGEHPSLRAWLNWQSVLSIGGMIRARDGRQLSGGS